MCGCRYSGWKVHETEGKENRQSAERSLLQNFFYYSDVIDCRQFICGRSGSWKVRQQNCIENCAVCQCGVPLRCASVPLHEDKTQFCVEKFRRQIGAWQDAPLQERLEVYVCDRERLK